jgi:uncharacterized protein
MKVDLSTAEGSPILFEFFLQPDEIDLENEVAKLKSPVRIEGKLTKRIAQTDVEGNICAEVELECTRCLQPVESLLEFSYEAVFVTPENYTEEKETELRAQDLEVSVFPGSEIDLTELAREQVLLNLPAKVFCTEDCKGLCQKCGANRNLIDCNCEEKEIDPRWAALKNLK